MKIKYANFELETSSDKEIAAVVGIATMGFGFLGSLVVILAKQKQLAPLCEKALELLINRNHDVVCIDPPYGSGTSNKE
ncbi:hypothetical protein ACFO3D_14425 [Virgibacillus kekensis]|uniref:Uncharacterized protein n=1 Tax=Virgibacillus kekensis TaxID=202261 RepID=A0ABV9DKN9_9BACI